MSEEIDISHYFSDWSRFFTKPSNEQTYEDGTPLTEYFTLTNREGITSYYLTIEGAATKYAFGIMAIEASNEAGGFFTPKAFEKFCNANGIRVKRMSQPEEEVEIKAAYKVGE